MSIMDNDVFSVEARKARQTLDRLPSAEAKKATDAITHHWAEQKHWSTFSGAFGYDMAGGLTNNRKPISDFQLLAEYLNNPIVYSCAEKNAKQVAGTPWKLYAFAPKGATTKALKQKNVKRVSLKQQKAIEKKARHIKTPADSEIVEVTDHPLIDLLSKSNEDLTGKQLFKVTELFLEIIGRAYWLTDVDDKGNERITVLKPQCIIPKRDRSGYVVGYYYYNYVEGVMTAPADKDGVDLTRVVELDREEVIDFRFVSPTDPYGGGASPLRAAIRNVLISSQFTEYMNAAVSNRQRPDWVFTPKQEGLSPDEIKRIEEKFLQKLGGVNNGKPIVLEQGMNAVPMSFSPTDLAPLNINKEVVKTVANAFDIPCALIDSDAATYSNYESALEDWARGGVGPRVSNFEDTINHNLSKLGIGDDGVFLCFDNPVPEDEAFELEEQKVAIAKLQAAAAAGVPMTDNEKRALLGLEPIDGGDTLPEDEPEEEAPDDPADEGDDGPAEGAADDAAAEDEEAKGFDRLLALNAFVAEGKTPRAIAINIAERMGFADAAKLIGYPAEHARGCDCDGKRETKATKPEDAAAKRLKSVLAAFFRDLRGEAVANVKSVKAADTGILPTEFVDVERWIHELRGKTHDLAHAVKPVIELAARQSADGKAEALGRVGASSDAFAVLPAKVNEAMGKRALRLAQATLETTQKTLRDAVDGIKEKIRQGLLEGDSVTELRRAVSDVLENAEDYQAERIARTEASAAVHSGQVIAAKESGIVKGFKYLVSSDACEVCQEYADEEIDIDDYDDSGEVDADGAVPLHPNCTCTLLEVLSDEDGEGKE